MSLYTHQEANVRKTWLLITFFLVLVTSVGYAFSQIYGNPSIVIIAFAASVVMSVSSYWFSDKIVIASMGARVLPDVEAPDLHNIVENLAITAGLPKPRIYIVDSPQPNAFATGRDKEHAVVAVTTGLLTLLDHSELEGVLAHELSHVGNRDVLVSTVVVVLLGAVQLLSDFFLRSLRFGGLGGGRDRNSGQAQAIFFLLGIALAILAPIAAVLIQLAVSRKREFLADASGALLTRYPDGLASALEKIHRDHTPMGQANHATAHLWFDDPYQGKQNTVKWFAKIFMTHPPVEDRIAALRGER